MRHPLPGLAHGLVLAAFGAALFHVAKDQFWWLAGAFSGFLLVAPLAATGLYAVSRAIERGELRADVDAAQLAFEIYGLMLGFHQNARLLRAADSTRRARAGLQRLIEDARNAPSARQRHAAAAGRLSSSSGRAARPVGGKARTSSP